MGTCTRNIEFRNSQGVLPAQKVDKLDVPESRGRAVPGFSRRIREAVGHAESQSEGAGERIRQRFHGRIGADG